MRIAQRTVSRNYKANLNRTMAKRAEALRRSEDGLRFKNLSEDVAAGARAMNTQEMRYAAIQQKNTAEELLKELDSAWGIMGAMDSTIQDVLEEMKSAAGVRTEEKLEAIQKKIHNLKEQYLQELNSQYSGKYLFGGTNNKCAPFTLNDSGKLLFNGVEVGRIHKGQQVGVVGNAADDAKYASDKTYYNNGVNYYSSSGGFYYSQDVMGADASGYSATLTGAAPSATLSMTLGGQPIQVWDEAGGSWVDFASQPVNGPTVDGAFAAQLLSDAAAGNGVRVGNDVYDLTNTNGQLEFTWKGIAEKETTGPSVLDKSAPGQAGALTGDLAIQLAPGAGTGVTENGDTAFALSVTGTQDNIPVPNSGAIYLDTGLGLTVSGGGGTPAEVDTRTAFEVNVVGLELVGFTGFVNEIVLDNGAYDLQTVPNNVYDAIDAVERMLAPGYSEDQLDALQMQLTRMDDTMRMSRTDVDTRANSLEAMIARLKTEIDGMEKLEDSLMTADPANEAINLKDIEYSWQAILALGSKILPSSLLDYLN